MHTISLYVENCLQASTAAKTSKLDYFLTTIGQDVPPRGLCFTIENMPSEIYEVYGLQGHFVKPQNKIFPHLIGSAIARYVCASAFSAPTDTRPPAYQQG